MVSPENTRSGPQLPNYPNPIAQLGMNAVERAALIRRNRQAALNELGHHLTEIAGDSSGSDPAPYVSPADLEILQTAVMLAESRHWPKGDKLHLEDTKFRWLPHRKPDTRVRDAAGNPVSGYAIGRLGVALHPEIVFLCSDGLLRSLRGNDLQGSTMRGAGKMPDPDILQQALDPGRQFGLEYTTLMRGKTLPQIIQQESGIMF